MTAPDLTRLAPCDRDSHGDCQVHDHGTLQDRLNKYGLCPAPDCGAVLDWQVERYGNDGWQARQFCSRESSHGQLP